MVLYKKISFWLILLIVIVSAFFLYKTTLRGLEVNGYLVKKKDLVISVTGTSTGTIKADKEVRLSAQRMGRISKLYVEEGSQVVAGNSIADLDSDEVQQRLLLASASMQRMNAQLDALKLGLVSLKADVESNINKAKAVLDEAEARLKRFQELKDKGFVSQSDLDGVKREHDVAKASWVAAFAARQQIRAREEEIKAQAAAVEQSQREYNLAKILLDYSSIKSPIAGVVTSRPVKIAETVPVGALVASVVSTDSLYIEAFIDEADAAKVAIGQQVNVTMDAYPEKAMTGEVTMISPVVLGNKQEARTFEARVRLLDKTIKTKPGMSADVEVIVSKKEHVLIIPSQAIIERNDAKYVYVGNDNRAVLRQIKTGQFNWTYTEVTEGIQEGDTVITNPDIAGLKDKARIKVLFTEK
ncbi:MAG: efflux RND transporter periplasmic adaptor subunit [Nitrospirota bacterium]|nr:efflux RND transporter periplasmic adaptor subunit [Nitrospirota bacterium]